MITKSAVVLSHFVINLKGMVGDHGSRAHGFNVKSVSPKIKHCKFCNAIL